MAKQVMIWDLPTRLFHWLLVLTFSACFTFSKLGGDFLQWHLWSGYVLLGLMTFRIVWGLVGTHYAKFKNFPLRLSQIRLAAHEFGNKVPASASINHLGHNPIGSLMVVFFIVAILLQAISGLFMDDEIFTRGPYAGHFGSAFDGVMAFIHHNLINVILVAIALHISAVFYYLKRKGQNLIRPMVSGRKQVAEIKGVVFIKSSRLIRAVLIVIAVSVFIYWLVVLNAPVVEEWY